MPSQDCSGPGNRGPGISEARRAGEATEADREEGPASAVVEGGISIKTLSGLVFPLMEEGQTHRLVIHAVLTVVAVVVIAALAIGCGDDSDSITVAGCKAVETPEPKNVTLPAPPQTVKAGEKLTAVVRTSCGTFEIELDTKQAPKTTNSFAYLAREGFYDGLDFNRVVSGFVVQGGDPLVGGDGGPGYTITEPPPADTAYTEGVVAMAKSLDEPSGQSGSQFFVVTSRNAGYGAEYALLGKVSKGYEVVDRINKLGAPDEKSRVPVLIEKITIKKG
ncbi:MAG TPA: peptidylprolyl isomerase [Solirubrobacterales bacterium]|jgi:cyclophilin family peptidyl-prolyl cis-trans isomerase